MIRRQRQGSPDIGNKNSFIMNDGRAALKLMKIDTRIGEEI